MVFVTALSLLTAVVIAWVLWVRTHRRRVRFEVPQGADVRSLMRVMAGLTWGHVSEGNRVTIVQNSGFFDAFLDDVARARHHIHLETFLWMDGAVSDRVSDALAARAREGIEVRVLVDQRGAKETSPAIWGKMNAAGCELRVYHRARLRELAWYNNRDHRKIVVVDGRIGYTFGHGMADMWGGSPEEPHGWRDTAARFEGPVVGDLQTAFLDNWIAVTRIALANEVYFPPLGPAGTTPLHVAYVAPPETSSSVQRLYYLAIAAAQREIILQNPYFIPDRQALALCIDAVRRGVAIHIMLPTAATSDFPVVQHASHYFYGPLLHAGVRIYEYTRCGLHQKVMIVDGVWCSLGSTNFDPRSFNINDEITVAMADPDIAAELRRAFEEDVRHADEWTAARWDARSWKHRAIDRASALIKRQL